MTTATIFVEYTDEEVGIDGKAELYGHEDDYDVVKILDDAGVAIAPGSARFKRLRDQLLHSQHVYDTLREAIYWDSREDA